MLDVSLSAGVNPVVLPVPSVGGQSARAQAGPVEDVQAEGGGGEARPHGRGGEAGPGRVVAGLLTARPVALDGGLDVKGPCRVLLLVVEEVTPGAVGTVASYPELLAPLGLVLAVLPHISHLLHRTETVSRLDTPYNRTTHVLPMSKLTEIPVQTVTLLLEVAADFRLEPDVGSRLIVSVSLGLAATDDVRRGPGQRR